MFFFRGPIEVQYEDSPVWITTLIGKVGPELENRVAARNAANPALSGMTFFVRVRHWSWPVTEYIEISKYCNGMWASDLSNCSDWDEARDYLSMHLAFGPRPKPNMATLPPAPPALTPPLNPPISVVLSIPGKNDTTVKSNNVTKRVGNATEFVITKPGLVPDEMGVAVSLNPQQQWEVTPPDWDVGSFPSLRQAVDVAVDIIRQM